MAYRFLRARDAMFKTWKHSLSFFCASSQFQLRDQLSDLSRKINADIHPVFTSRKIKDQTKAKEPKPPIVNQQNVVHYYKCDLCDADYVGFTSRHLHQRVEEHKRSVTGNHVKEQHGKEPQGIAENFKILRKCQNKFDCLIFEMFFIRDLKPKLNKQSDSIHPCKAVCLAALNTFYCFLGLFYFYC